ncbi:hypothetical protein ABIB07_008265 [Bradyrhizobium sp. RT10b]
MGHVWTNKTNWSRLNGSEYASLRQGPVMLSGPDRPH